MTAGTGNAWTGGFFDRLRMTGCTGKAWKGGVRENKCKIHQGLDEKENVEYYLSGEIITINNNTDNNIIVA